MKGVVISKDDFCSTIITSLPKYLLDFAFGLLTSTWLINLLANVVCAPFILMISEESNHKATEKKWNRKGKMRC